MSVSVKNSATEKVLRDILKREGYELTPELGDGEIGVDIIAGRGDEVVHIEVIGYSASPPKRSLDFYQAFFRAISRIKDGARVCAIALPSRYKNGWSQRVEQYGVAWERISTAFPELEVWFVDVDEGHYERMRWG